MEQKNVNHGIDCNVTDCIYHAEQCICTAPKIKVGPTHAECSSQTACETFKSAEDCHHCK